MLTHHAYYIEDSLSSFDAYKVELSPFVAEVFERFGIDEARALSDRAALKNFGGQTIFLIGMGSMTSEAQQALLKLFEEPQAGTVFVLLLPHGMLLPTLKSRMLPYPNTPDKPDYFSAPVRAFLRASGKERSDLIAKLLKDDEGQRDRVRDFVNGLEAELASKTKDAQARAALEDIAMVRDYLADRSPSMKMLLEHLALSLPQR